MQAPTRRATKPAGQWNALEIRAEGRRIVIVLNGKNVEWLEKVNDEQYRR